jgi:hypothetical protein
MRSFYGRVLISRYNLRRQLAILLWYKPDISQALVWLDEPCGQRANPAAHPLFMLALLFLRGKIMDLGGPWKCYNIESCNISPAFAESMKGKAKHTTKQRYPPTRPKGQWNFKYEVLEVLGHLLWACATHVNVLPSGTILVLLVMILVRVPDPNSIKFTW